VEIKYSEKVFIVPHFEQRIDWIILCGFNANINIIKLYPGGQLYWWMKEKGLGEGRRG
jgi:hypothetical protein